jgi:hypothetical protein
VRRAGWDCEEGGWGTVRKAGWDCEEGRVGV